MPTAEPPTDDTEPPIAAPPSCGAGRCRVRLVVRDPETLFAYWTLSEDVRDALCRELGERVAALSTVTLRLFDVTGGSSRLLIQRGIGSATYLPVEPGWGPHQADLGLLLPSGEFRPLATSNPVVPPRHGPSPEPATRSLAYGDQRVAVAAPGPDPRAARPRGTPPLSARGGASDTLRPGGASDTFRP